MTPRQKASWVAEFLLGVSHLKYCLHLCGYEGISTCYIQRVEVRGQPTGVGFLLLTCEFWRVNSGQQAWWEAPFSPAPSHCIKSYNFLSVVPLIPDSFMCLLDASKCQMQITQRTGRLYDPATISRPYKKMQTTCEVNTSLTHYSTILIIYLT